MWSSSSSSSSAAAWWTSLASIMGVLAFLQTLLHVLFPPELRMASGRLLARLSTCFSTYCYFDIADTDGVSTNELYNAVQLYLSNSASVSGSRVSLTRAPNSSAFTFGLSNNDRLLDTFGAAQAAWEHVVTQRQAGSFSWRPVPDEKRGFVLRVRKKDRALMLPAYLEHIMEIAGEIRRRSRDRLLYTNSGRGGGGGVLDSRGCLPWESVPFKHPSTFDTLAMDPARKAEIMEDLREFAAGGDFYNKTGRAWKRGYLLYGPPGTGKSSMIAAMANFLGYDVYDLELTEVHTNSDLRKLLMKTTSKSIIVIEDIDCSLTLGRKQGRSGSCSASDIDLYDDAAAAAVAASGGRPGAPPQIPLKSITLSGLLNFTDGLWSCCGSERIFVFTTNHVERLDPALLRSGRMDMHIHMSYCAFPSLNILIKNYLNWSPPQGDGVHEEAAEPAAVVVLRQLESVVEAAEMTPADVSEVLIRNRRKETHVAMGELLVVMKARVAAAKRKRKAGGGGETSEGEEVEEKRALDSPSSSGGGHLDLDCRVAAATAEDMDGCDTKDGREGKGQD